MAGTESYLASVDLWAGNYAPHNWAFCQGQLLAIQGNAALYALLSNRFGGDGQTNFALPDMRGRTAVGMGNGIGLTERILGQKGGQETIVLTLAQMPAHIHTATFTPAGAANLTGSVALPVKTGLGTGSNNPAGNYFGPSGSTNLYYSDTTPNTFMAPVTVDISGGGIGGVVTVANTGNNAPVPVLQPYAVLNYIICTSGTFPPRS